MLWDFWGIFEDSLKFFKDSWGCFEILEDSLRFFKDSRGCLEILEDSLRFLRCSGMIWRILGDSLRFLKILWECKRISGHFWGCFFLGRNGFSKILKNLKDSLGFWRTDWNTREKFEMILRDSRKLSREILWILKKFPLSFNENAIQSDSLGFFGILWDSLRFFGIPSGSMEGSQIF